MKWVGLCWKATETFVTLRGRRVGGFQALFDLLISVSFEAC